MNGPLVTSDVRNANRPFQFTLQGMLGAVAGVAFYLGVAVHFGLAVIVPLMGLCISFPGWPSSGQPRRVFLGTLALSQIALVFGAWSCHVSYHIDGDIGSGLWWLLWGLVGVIGSIFFAFRFHWVGLVLMLALCGMLFPRQWVLVRRYYHLESEVRRIVAYVEQQRLDRGEPPSNLDAFRFDRPKLRDYIKYEVDNEGYFIEYHPVIDANIQHWYSSRYGWGYNDD